MDLTLSTSSNMRGQLLRPSFVTQPSIEGVVELGQTLTFLPGYAQPGPVSYEIIRLRLDGVDKRSELVGQIWDTSGQDISGGGVISYRVRATNARGSRNSGVVTAVLVPVSQTLMPPVFDTQPSLTGNFEVGGVLGLDLGSAGPDLSALELASFTLDGVDKLAELAGLSWDTSGEDVSAGGQIAVQARAINADGTTLSDVITATLAPAPLPLPWEFDNIGAGQFDIMASTPNSPAPPLLDMGTGAALLGDPGSGWLLTPAGDQRLRILQSNTNPAAPAVSDAGDGQIQLGV